MDALYPSMSDEFQIPSPFSYLCSAGLPAATQNN